MSRTADRTPAWRAVAVALAAALAGSSLAACSVSGGDAAATGDPSTTTTADTPERSEPEPSEPDAAPPAPSTGGEPDPAVDDVEDPVYGGLGDPRIDVAHYDVVVRSDPGEPRITGTATLTLSARTAEPLESFTLDLRGPEIADATVDGEPAEVAPAEDDEVAITPAEPLEPGAEVEVVLAYAGEPDPVEFPGLGIPIGWQPDDQGGWFAISQPDGTATWVPVSDHPSDKATWTITLDTPEGLVGVSNGKLTSRDVEDGRRQWVWEMDEPMASYLLLAAVGRYDLVERDGPGGVEIVLAFPTDLPERRRSGFDEMDDMLTFFEDTFGGVPDDDAGAIVVPASLGLALETQTRPVFGLEAAGDGEVWALAHELAHQWYGNAVTPVSWRDLWISEGFATYADWLYQDHVGEVDIDASAAGDGERIPSFCGCAVLDTEAAVTFDGAVYDGGARVLHALRRTIGDDDFFEVLQRWFAENRGTSVTTEDFVALAEEVSGDDLTTFFDQWLNQDDQPPMPN